jgi:hypothetical protein
VTDPWTNDVDDEGGLYVNFSDEEASSESRDMEPLPSGKYLATITDVDMRESKSEKNYGKAYYAIEFTVVEDRAGGTLVGRKCWTNAMLFNPALYTISHIMKALNMPVSAGRLRVPSPAELIDQVIMIGGVKVGEQKDKTDPSKTYQPKFEPKSFFSKDRWAAAGTATGKTSAAARSSLLS